jgi:hypothetical protein
MRRISLVLVVFFFNAPLRPVFTPTGFVGVPLCYLFPSESPSPSSPQEKPFLRTFSIGAPHRYRIRLTVRSELEGRRPVSIGSQTYVEPLTASAESSISWRDSRRVLSLNADGSAEFEETLDEFAMTNNVCEGTDAEKKKLCDALASTLSAWTASRTLRYRETPAGQLLGLDRAGVPPLGENAPPLLTLWLLRALRPTVALPSKPLAFGQPWQEPRAVQLEAWSDVRGAETGEWLETSGASEPAVRLHLVQQISGSVAQGADLHEAGAAQARFHAESLSTLSLLDARLLAAERSALRELSWTLESVPGLPEPQRFRARLSVQVQIEDCRNTACLAAPMSQGFASPPFLVMLSEAKHLSSVGSPRPTHSMLASPAHSGSPLPEFQISNFEFRSSNLEPQTSASTSPQHFPSAPHFTPGQTLRYLIESHTRTESRSSGAISDPQAPKSAEVSLTARIRLEVLSVTQASPNHPGQVRLRSTYEKLTSNTKTDQSDPTAAQPQPRFSALEGKSLEFTLRDDGTLRDVQGLEAVFPEDQSIVRDWLEQFARGIGPPKVGIAPGRHWSSEEPLTGFTPLLGLVRRNALAYLRDAPCPAARLLDAEKTEAVPTGDVCAVIQTRSELFQRKKFRDPTPDEYRRRGLRTSGRASGSGESLAYVSLRSGLVVDASHNSAEDMDLTISNRQLGTEMRYSIRVRTESNIVLLVESPARQR